MNVANTDANKIGTRVYLRHRHGGEEAVVQLRQQRTEIEREIGAELNWEAQTPEAKDKIIGLYRDADLAKKEEWPDYISWLVETTLKFREAFGPRVRALDLTSSSDDEGPDEEP